MSTATSSTPFLTEVLWPVDAVARLRRVGARIVSQSGDRKQYRSSAGWITVTGVGRQVRLEFFHRCPTCPGY